MVRFPNSLGTCFDVVQLFFRDSVRCMCNSHALGLNGKVPLHNYYVFCCCFLSFMFLFVLVLFLFFLNLYFIDTD